MRRYAKHYNKANKIYPIWSINDRRFALSYGILSWVSVLAMIWVYIELYYSMKEDKPAKW